MIKKIMIALCVAFCLFAVGYNSWQSEKQATTGKKKVYAILPVTGGHSFQGKDEKRAMEVWMKQHPEAPFELEILDNESNATKSLTLAQRAAMSDKHPLFIVPIGAMGHPIIPQLKSMNGFMILSPSTQEEDGTYKEFQRISQGAADMNKPMFDMLKKGQSAVIIHSNEMAGHTSAGKTQKIMQEKGMKILEKIAFDLKELDMRILVLKALSYKPDVIFVTSGPGIGFINIIKELKVQQYPGIILADPSITTPSVFELLKEYADGIYTSIMPTERTYREHPEMIKALADNNLPLYWVPINIWDIMDVVNHFITNNIPFSQEEFMKMGKWHGLSCDVQFLPNGNSSYEFSLVVVKDGQFVPVKE